MSKKEKKVDITDISNDKVGKKLKPKVKIVVEIPKRKKGWPRGRPFAKGNPMALKPGTNRHDMSKPQNPPYSVNPKPEGHKLISKSYSARLGDMCTIPGYTDLTWAEAIARGIIEAAVSGDVAAAREVREVTEGKLPETHRIGGADGPPIPVQVDQIDARIRALIGESAGKHVAGAENGAPPATGTKKQPS